MITAGETLIYKVDGRMVEFRGYAENDPDGAYIYPLSGYGGELYVSIRQLDRLETSVDYCGAIL